MSAMKYTLNVLYNNMFDLSYYIYMHALLNI